MTLGYCTPASAGASIPITMNKSILALLAATLPLTAIADDRADCQAAAGTFLIGKVTQEPRFAEGKTRRNGIWLSHTVLTVVDREGHSYRIAADNVFASGYVHNQRAIPSPLDTIHVGDKLELCGQAFSDPSQDGLHWVHTNCGARPTRNKPDGWIKLIGSDGRAGPNMEGNTRYCGLW